VKIVLSGASDCGISCTTGSSVLKVPAGGGPAITVEKLTPK
jgi:hypothetical protein